MGKVTLHKLPADHDDASEYGTAYEVRLDGARIGTVGRGSAPSGYWGAWTYGTGVVRSKATDSRAAAVGRLVALHLAVS